MIGELLDVSRLEAGKALDLRVGPLDLVALCNAVLEGQRAALQGKSGYQLQVTDPGGPAWIVADADRMEQIVVNLVSNAVKYSPDGGKICVDIEDPGGCVILRISDQGMGMAPEQMKNLFQKFYRTPDARRSGIKGTGLGLYLIKQLIEAHGGTISVVSAPGQGTAFTVELPKPEEK
jgi:signal transduction histidine kinase